MVGATLDDPGTGMVSAAFCTTAVTGQMVVYSATISVVTLPSCAEHSLDPSAQELTVYTLLV
jgi:hypothetical protein